MIDPEFDKYHKQSRAELIADVIDDTDKVAHALEIQRAPDISNRRFLFELHDRPYVLPHSINGSIDPTSQATQLTIDIEENRLLQKCELSMQLSFSGARDFVIFITSTKKGSKDPFSASMVFIDDLSNNADLETNSPELPLFEALKKTEINTLIASLIAPNKTHDYRMYDTMDLTSAQTVHHVAEALEEKADSTISELDYFTGDVLSLDADQIKFMKVDGKIADATVQRSLARGAVTATITLDRTLSPPEDSGDTPQSFEGIRTYSKNIDGEGKERDVDFDILVSIHDFLRSLKDTMFDPEITSFSTTSESDTDEEEFGGDDEKSFLHEDSADDSTTLNIEDLNELNRDQQSGRDD